MYNSALSIKENVIVDIAQFVSALNAQIQHSRFLSPLTQPDKIKTYSIRPELSNHRVFLPASYKQDPDAADTKLPLVITVHGGAWIVGDPADDDMLNRHLADQANVVVVGINHSKAPQRPFPQGLSDIIALIPAVVADPSLPIDRGRVILSGGSSGANLVLAAVQDPAVHAAVRISGLIAICPPVDLATSKDDKMARRARPEAPDVLERFVDSIIATYLEKARDVQPRDDPRLSPLYFTDRACFPTNLYFIGFEDDLLCREAEMMAEKLAADTFSDRHKTERGWQAGSVTWELIEKTRHGFAAPRGESAQDKKTREDDRQALHERMAAWVSAVCASDLTAEST